MVIKIATPMIEWMSIAEAEGLSIDQIRARLVASAQRQGYEPAAVGWRGDPVVEVRGRYQVMPDDSQAWIENFYAMPVEKIEAEQVER